MKLNRLKRRVRRRWTKTRRWRTSTTFALFVALLHLYIFTGVLGTRLEPKITNYWFMIQGRREAPKDVLIVAIDEKSHEQFGASTLEPWPRELTARLLERLANFKPRAVVIDFWYNQNLDPQVDARLANALTQVPSYIAAVKKDTQRVSIDGELINQSELLAPAKRFKENAQGIFIANIAKSDVVRHFLPHNYHSETDFMPLSEIAFGKPGENLELPTNRDFINFYGPPGSIVTIPFYELLNSPDKVFSRAVTDKYIFIGQRLFMAYKAQQMDTFMTPFQKATAGVEIHATVLGNLLDKSWIRRFPRKYEALAALFAAGILTYLIVSLTPLVGLVVLLVSILGWAVLSYFMFSAMNLFLPGAILVFGILPLVYTVSSFRYYFRARKLEEAMGIS